MLHIVRDKGEIVRTGSCPYLKVKRIDCLTLGPKFATNLAECLRFFGAEVNNLNSREQISNFR